MPFFSIGWLVYVIAPGTVVAGGVQLIFHTRVIHKIASLYTLFSCRVNNIEVANGETVFARAIVSTASKTSAPWQTSRVYKLTAGVPTGSPAVGWRSTSP